MQRVYISSTYDDLRDCREAADRAVRRLKCQPIAMEDYIASDERPLDRCLADVRSCHIYVGLVAWRYGFVPPGNNKSITHLEYDEAGRAGIPRLLFLLDESAPWPEDLRDQDSMAVRAFRDGLCRERLLSQFNSVADVDQLLTSALSLHLLATRSARRVEADVVRYAQRMRQKYRVLDLADLQRQTVDDPGRVLLRDAFVPQKVREDPPADEIPRDLLSKLVEDGEWSDDEVERHEYLARQIKRVRDVYVQRPPRPVVDIVAEPRNRRLVLLGGPGSGKSTLARYLLLSVLELREKANVSKWLKAFRGHLPLLLDLREFIIERGEKRSEGFLDFLHNLGKTDGYFLDAGWLDDLLKTEPSLVLFDGLDEIFDPRDRDRVAQMIVGFAATYPRTRLVVTSRPIGYHKKALDDADFRHFALEDLDETQVESFVRGWFGLVFPQRPREAEQRIDRVLKATKASRLIRLLAGNPMLLTIMTLIAQSRELPRERWHFYDYAAEVLCHHWDVNRRLKDAGLHADYIDLEDKKELLRRIAFHMQAAEGGMAGNFIRAQALTEVIEGYLVQRYRHPPAEAKRVASALIQQLRERNYVLCRRGPGIYGFVHRTFLEYFCAYELVARLEKTPEFTVVTLRDQYFARHWNDPAWAEPLKLVCGMVGSDDAAPLIEFLTFVNRHWRLMFVQPYMPLNFVNQHFQPTLPVPPRHLILAAQCLAEARTLRDLGSAPSRLLREIFDVLEIPDKDQFIEGRLVQQIAEDVIGAISDVEGEWPRYSWLDSRYLHTLGQVHPLVLMSYARLLVAVLADNVRQPLIDLATHDRRSDLRSAALGSLARGWPGDESMRELFRERVENAPHEDARSMALKSLARGWPGDESIRELLRDRAENDPGEHLRGWILESFAEHWPGDASIRDFLLYRAEKDQVVRVQVPILQALAQGWSDDASVRDLLQDRAKNHQHWAVRDFAVESLDRHWSRDETILEFLRERAENDENEAVRRAALKATR